MPGFRIARPPGQKAYAAGGEVARQKSVFTSSISIIKQVQIYNACALGSVMAAIYRASHALYLVGVATNGYHFFHCALALI